MTCMDTHHISWQSTLGDTEQAGDCSLSAQLPKFTRPVSFALLHCGHHNTAQWHAHKRCLLRLQHLDNSSTLFSMRRDRLKTEHACQWPVAVQPALQGQPKSNTHDTQSQAASSLVEPLQATCCMELTQIKHGSPVALGPKIPLYTSVNLICHLTAWAQPAAEHRQHMGILT